MKPLKPKRKLTLRQRVERKIHHEIKEAYFAIDCNYAFRCTDRLIAFVLKEILEAEKRGMEYGVKNSNQAQKGTDVR